MRLFNHEIFWGNGAYSFVMGREIEKRLRSALSDSSGLQQASGHPSLPQEQCRQIEEGQLDALRDIVMAVCNRDVVAFSEPQKWGTAGKENMVGWKALCVDHERKTVDGRYGSMGPQYGKRYIVLLPDSLVGNEELYAKLLAPKPPGFDPNIDMGGELKRYAKHLLVCYEKQICTECGLPLDEDRSGAYCEIHDPYGKYYPQWWDVAVPQPDKVTDG